MFERFTDRARRVVVLAGEEARLLRRDYIGTEHILLGLIHEGEGVGAKALLSLGVSLEGVRHHVEEIVGHGNESPPVHLPFTIEAKKSFELALREALQLGHNYIGTEHILLGLIRGGDSISYRLFGAMDVSLSNARRAVIDLLRGYEPPTTLPSGPVELRGVRIRDLYRDMGDVVWEVVALCDEPTATVRRVDARSSVPETHVIGCLNWTTKWKSGPLRESA